MALIPGFLLLDFFVHGRRYEATRLWRLRATLVTAAIFFFTAEVAVLWGKLFGDFHLFDSRGLGTLGGAVLGVLVYQLVLYWYHASHRRSARRLLQRGIEPPFRHADRTRRLQAAHELASAIGCNR